MMKLKKCSEKVKKMRKDIQEINNNMDKNKIIDNKNKNDSIDILLNKNIKGNKPSLKPIVIKKEDNKIFKPNNNNNKLYTRKGNMIPGNNKNKKINENNKNSASQKYNEILYKLKK